MAGPIPMTPVVEAALRVRPRPGVTTAMQPELDLLSLMQPGAKQPTVVLVGIGRTPPKTTAALIDAAVQQGMEPGRDIIATRYADLRVGERGGFVRLAQGTAEPGRVLAGQGNEALFLFRGGGNLREAQLEKIGKIQAVDGATALTDLSFIQRAGSKAITNDRLAEAGLALAETVPVHGVDEATAAFDRITGRFSTETAVLKKVNSLGGKDVHFVTSHEDIAKVIAKEPDADFVMQEFLPAAKDQDVRVHMVWNSESGAHEVANSYVRNRVAFAQTPNLANGGFPIGYELSPWEESQALRAAAVLSQGSPHAPLHVGLDLFPRNTITPSVIEGNAALRQAVASGELSQAAAIAKSADTAVIGEAASSAGTKGTELVLGEGVNPVTTNMMREIAFMRAHGVSPLNVDTTRAAAAAVSTAS